MGSRIIFGFMLAAAMTGCGCMQNSSLNEKLRTQKQAIDTARFNMPWRMTRYEQPLHSDTLYEVRDYEDITDSIRATYWLYRDTTGRISFIAERPYYYEPDLPMETRHYFDEDGKLFVVEHEELPEGASFILTGYYNEDFKLIAVEDSINDQGGNRYEMKTSAGPLTSDHILSPAYLEHIRPTYDDYIRSRKFVFKRKS